MKLMAFVALLTLLLVSNCLAISFVPTSEDIAWTNEVIQDTKVIPSDLELISLTANNNDLPGTKKYCDLAAIDIQVALGNSQRYTVSSELREAKYYWEAALETMGEGVETASRGCAIGDGSLIRQGSRLMVKGSENLMLASRALKIATASSESEQHTEWKPVV